MFNVQLEETLQTGLMKRLEELEECPFDLYHNDVLEVPEIQTFLKGRYYIEVLTETKPERQALLGILCGEVRFDYCSPKRKRASLGRFRHQTRVNTRDNGQNASKRTHFVPKTGSLEPKMAQNEKGDLGLQERGRTRLLL